MLNSGKKISALCDIKNKYSNLTLALSEKYFLNETKNHNPPPFKLNGRSLTHTLSWMWMVFARYSKYIGLLH